MLIPTTAAAVAASVACGHALGLPTDDPEVLAEGYSVRVRLRPSPVVTRVVTVGRALRPDPMPWLEREVAVATFLASTDLPVVGPWTEPGPHLADGLEVSLWDWVEHEPGPVSPRLFGQLVGELHAALAPYGAELAPLAGPLCDIATALKISDDPVLHRSAEELVNLALSWPRRPLHGDSHTGNVLLTPTGPRWTDFEDVCAGPVEWDLASMTLTEEALAAYPGDIDRERLADCRDLRRLQILASLLVDGGEHEELRDDLRSHLRRRHGLVRPGAPARPDQAPGLSRAGAP